MKPTAEEGGIRWPDRYAPGVSPVHVRNELEIQAPPDTVWAWLVRAALWPSWYPNSRDVLFLRGAPPDLAEGSRFRWKTFGVTIESAVEEFEPPARVAWRAWSPGIDVYHAWWIRPSGEGCVVVTEETQHGWLARLSALAMPGRMYRYHQLWLERLGERAATGLPPAP